jgi:hypothetical protein
MRVKVMFEFDGYDVIAVGKALNEDAVDDLSITLIGVREEEYPSGDEMEVIELEAQERIIEKAFCPEVE